GGAALADERRGKTLVQARGGALRAVARSAPGTRTWRTPQTARQRRSKLTEMSRSRWRRPGLTTCTQSSQVPLHLTGSPGFGRALTDVADRTHAVSLEFENPGPVPSKNSVGPRGAFDQLLSRSADTQLESPKRAS